MASLSSYRKRLFHNKIYIRFTKLVRLVISPCEQTLQLNYHKLRNHPVSSAYYLLIDQPYGAQSVDPVAQFVGRYLESGRVQENICKFSWAVRAVTNFRRPMYPSTLILLVAWISSLPIMALRVVITSVKSAPVGLLKEPKNVFQGKIL